MRETVAAGDLIPGDLIINRGATVERHAHGAGTLPGTRVPCEVGVGVFITYYYPDSETEVEIIR